MWHHRRAPAAPPASRRSPKTTRWSTTRTWSSSSPDGAHDYLLGPTSPKATAAAPPPFAPAPMPVAPASAPSLSRRRRKPRRHSWPPGPIPGTYIPTSGTTTPCRIARRPPDARSLLVVLARRLLLVPAASLPLDVPPPLPRLNGSSPRRRRFSPGGGPFTAVGVGAGAGDPQLGGAAPDGDGSTYRADFP